MDHNHIIFSHLKEKKFHCIAITMVKVKENTDNIKE